MGPGGSGEVAAGGEAAGAGAEAGEDQMAPRPGGPGVPARASGLSRERGLEEGSAQDLDFGNSAVV